MQKPVDAERHSPDELRQPHRGQYRFDLLALRLQPGGQDQALPQRVLVLVNCEPGAVGGDLKKDAAGFPEIDGAKPEAVDHWRDGDAARRYGLLPALLFRGIWRTPGHVMDCANGDAPSPLAGLRQQVEQRSRPTLAGLKTQPAFGLRRQPESQRVREEGTRRIHARLLHGDGVHAADRVLRRDRRVIPGGPKRTVSCVRSGDQFQIEAVRIGEGDDLLIEPSDRPLKGHAARAEAADPVIQRTFGNGKRDRRRLAHAGNSRCAAGPGEKGEFRPGMPEGVAVEEVIGSGVILVHAALHQAQTQQADIEVDVLLGISRNGRHVMDAPQLHYSPMTRSIASPPAPVKTSEIAAANSAKSNSQPVACCAMNGSFHLFLFAQMATSISTAKRIPSWLKKPVTPATPFIGEWGSSLGRP